MWYEYANKKTSGYRWQQQDRKEAQQIETGSAGAAMTAVAIKIAAPRVPLLVSDGSTGRWCGLLRLLLAGSGESLVQQAEEDGAEDDAEGHVL